MIFCASTVAFLLITIFFTFEYRVDIGGDNASYILRAFKFLKDGNYPTFQGPLYPLVLSIFLNTEEINLTFLKGLSGLFLLMNHVLLILTFRKELPLVLLLGALVALSLCQYYIFFGSETYSEAFFLMIQGMFLLIAVRSNHSQLSKTDSTNNLIWSTSILAIICLLLGLTRSIGFSGFISVLIFFIIQRDYKRLMVFTLAFGSAFLLYRLTLTIIYDASEIQFSSQASQLLLKNPYDVSQGKEDLSGLVRRFIANTQFYLGYCISMFTGFSPISAIQSSIVSLVVWSLLFAVLLKSAFNRNGVILLTCLYCIISLAVEFVILQTTWTQYRLIIPYYPIIIILVLYLIYELLLKLKWFKAELIIPLVLLLGVCINSSISSYPWLVEKSQISNLHRKGYDLAGYTPDIQNYIRMSRYVSDKIPSDEIVGCRKPSLAFLYSSREFAGIYREPDWNIDSLSETDSLVVMKFADFSKLSKLTNLDKAESKILAVFMSIRVLKPNLNYNKNTLYCLVDMSRLNNSLFLRLLYKTSSFIDYDIHKHREYLTDIKYTNPTQLIKNLKSRGIDYLMVGNLRTNAKVADGRVIGTIRRQVVHINFMYPNFLELIHTIGKEESSSLYRLNYDHLKNDE